MSSLIGPGHIIGTLTATSKRAVLAEMAALFPEFDQDELQAALLEREAVGSTAIDPGLAVPHAKLPAATEIQVCFARSKAGIQWGAADRQPVHLIFMMVAPMDASAQYLQTLASLCRFLRDDRNRTMLMISDDDELAQIFASAKELI